MKRAPQKKAGQITEPVKVGEVTIYPWKPGRVQLYFRLPDGSRHRPVVAAVDRESAEAMAGQVASALQSLRLAGFAREHPLDVAARLQGKGPVTVPTVDAGPSISDALEQAIEKGSRAREEWKDELRTCVNQFIDWLAERYPALPNRWSAVTYSIVQEYVATLGQLSQDRIAHRFAPIRLAARFWEAQDPDRFRDFTRTVRLPEGKPRRPPVVLTTEQLTAFLEAVEKLSPALYPLAALTALAGLRVYEAAHLRLCDVDLKAGTVTVTETEHHTPKNKGSWRTVPLAPAALRLLTYLIGKHQPVDPTAPIFVTPSGLPWDRNRFKQAWKRLRAAIDKANEKAEAEKREKIQLPPGFTLRAGRRTFVTNARKAGADRELLKRYVGHSAGDVTGLHYDAVDGSDLATVAGAFERSLANAQPTAEQRSEESQ